MQEDFLVSLIFFALASNLAWCESDLTMNNFAYNEWTELHAARNGSEDMSALKSSQVVNLVCLS